MPLWKSQKSSPSQVVEVVPCYWNIVSGHESNISINGVRYKMTTNRHVKYKGGLKKYMFLHSVKILHVYPSKFESEKRKKKRMM